MAVGGGKRWKKSVLMIACATRSRRVTDVGRVSEKGAARLWVFDGLVDT